MRRMVNRVAEAIWMANQPEGAPGWNELNFNEQDTVEIIAKAAIMAMYEPTKEMVKAAFDHPDQLDHQRSDANAFIRQWKTAIDEALKED